MDIYAPSGSKVVFSHPGAGYEHHQDTAKQYLKVGKIYTVDRTDVDRWHTDVFLKEVPDVAFNSVMFEMEKKGQRKRDQRLKRLCKDFQKWTTSPDGQRTIEEALQQSKEIKAALDRAHRIKPESLKLAFTI